MTLRFVLCERCGAHGRFIGAPETVPIEVASKSTALRHLDRAEQCRLITNERRGALDVLITDSPMANADDEEYLDPRLGRCTVADPALLEAVMEWNITARATNDSDRFAQSAFPCPKHPAATASPVAVVA